jgi:hypothetical protein
MFFIFVYVGRKPLTTMQDASGENVTVRTSNAPIEGNFRASRSIVLQTENAPINVAVELENANSTQPSTASLHTSNA